MSDFRKWLVKHDACPEALDWLDEQPDQSPEAIWQTCPRGDWLLWWHEAAGTAPESLTAVSYAAANRALDRAADALDAVGVEHTLRSHRVVDEKTSADAARAARAAAKAVAGALETAGDAWATAWYAGVAADAAWGCPWAAAEAAADAAEHQQCADDCRATLGMPEVSHE